MFVIRLKEAVSARQIIMVLSATSIATPSNVPTTDLVLNLVAAFASSTTTDPFVISTAIRFRIVLMQARAPTTVHAAVFQATLELIAKLRHVARVLRILIAMLPRSTAIAMNIIMDQVVKCFVTRLRLVVFMANAILMASVNVRTIGTALNAMCIAMTQRVVTDSATTMVNASATSITMARTALYSVTP